jgi:phosphate-selective porin
MAGKPFSTKLYNNDDNAKDQVIDWLKSKAWSAEVNPDQYGIDVIATDLDGEKHYFEVEVKHNWKGPKFQYDTLHYSERKRKFLNTPDNTAFITLNHERTHALMVPGDVLAKAPTITKDTIYTRNEKFIEVSVGSCILIGLEEENG